MSYILIILIMYINKAIMLQKNSLANVPVSGAEARLSETGVVESQNVNISAGQEEQDQATTAASAVEPMTLHLGRG